MVKTIEPLLNVVTRIKPKVLKVSARGRRLEPKGKGSGPGAPNSPGADGAPPAKRRNLTHLNQVLSWNVVSPLVSPWESKPQGVPMGQRVREGGRSESRSVMGRIGVAG
jgi:hypothetical protein